MEIENITVIEIFAGLKKKKNFCIVHLQLSRPRTTHPTKMTF